MIAQLFRTGSMTIAWLLIIPCLIILFGAIVPVVPWLRIYAVSMVPNHSPWLAFGDFIPRSPVLPKSIQAIPSRSSSPLPRADRWTSQRGCWRRSYPFA